MTEDDWRLQGQEGHLRGARLRWKAWWEYRQGWDHDDCEFCWKKFGPGALASQSEEEVLGFGFVTEDDYRWICPVCFRDFRRRFEWELDVASSDDGLEDFV